MGKEEAREMVRSSLALVLLVFAFGNSKADWQGYYTLSAGYDSNPTIQEPPLPSSFVRNSFGLGLFPDSSNYAFSYTGSLTNLFEFPERNYHSHSIKADYSIYPFSTEKFEFVVGGEFNSRLNAKDVEAFDYNELSAAIAFNTYAENYNLSILYAPNSTNYIYNKDISNSTNDISISTDLNLAQNISIYLYSGLAVRNYYNLISSQEAQPIPGLESDTPIPYGKRKQNKYNGSNQGSNPTDSSSSGSNQGINIEYYSNISSIIYYGLSLNYSMSDMISFNVEYGSSLHLSDDGAYYNSGEIDLLSEMEFFDDVFNFEQNEFSLTLSSSPFENFDARISFRYYDRNYLYSLYAVDPLLSEDAFREDSGRVFTFDMKYSYPINLGFVHSFSNSVKLNYHQNKSNLSTFNFNSSSIIFSAIFEF